MTGEQSVLVYPMLALMLLTFGIGMWLGVSRTKYALSEKLREDEFALKSDVWPEYIQKIANNFNNLFQVPMFFFVVCLMIMQNGMVDAVIMTLAWIFVASRYVHSLIHTTYNKVTHRFLVYLVGVFANAAMMIYFAAKFSNII